MSHIAIIGPGAIGGALAAFLEKAGRHRVTLCGRRPLEQLTIETDTGSMTLRPNVLTSPDDASPADVVLVATKAYDTAGAAAWFPRLVSPSTTIAILQNGIEHVERFSPYAPAGQILPVIVLLPAERLEPTRIRQRGTAKLAAPVNEHGRRLAEIFAGTEVTVELPSDFRDRLWRKLIGNAPGILNALLLRPTGAMHDERIGELVRAIASECEAVGIAEGITFEPDVVGAVLRGVRRAPPDSINSIHADRLAGRPLETDARNGVIVRLGKKHGIPTPCNAMAVTLLDALDPIRSSGR